MISQNLPKIECYAYYTNSNVWSVALYLKILLGNRNLKCLTPRKSQNGFHYCPKTKWHNQTSHLDTCLHFSQMNSLVYLLPFFKLFFDFVSLRLSWLQYYSGLVLPMMVEKSRSNYPLTLPVTSLSSFRKRLKAYIFINAYPPQDFHCTT